MNFTQPYISIGSKAVGGNLPCFIVAEAGVNHNGSLEQALRMVDEAKEAGVDAVKFQTYITEELSSTHADKAEYQKKHSDAQESQFEMLKKLELSFEEFRHIKRYCDEKEILFLSSPFDVQSSLFLDALDVEAIKIGSGELTHLPLLRQIGEFQRPVILSTGMATIDEIRKAVEVVKENGEHRIILLHCTSNYPTAFEDVHLLAMRTMGDFFRLPVGYSDHTMGIEVAIAARTLGACVIEKHFTLDRSLPGPDHQCSLEPRELKALTKAIRNIEVAFGRREKMPSKSEMEVARVARKSLVAACDIKEGAVLTQDMIAIRRPGTGLPPGDRESLIGKKAQSAISAGSILQRSMFDE